MAVELEPVIRAGREGNRWYNLRPAADDVAEWFASVRLHEGMRPEDYIGGITMIQATEKSDEVTGFDKDGMAVIRERKDLVHIPYVKVDTRVRYFWDYVELHESRGWRGEIRPVPNASSVQLGLPDGFFRYSATDPKAADKHVNFVGISMQATIYERSRASGGADIPILRGSPGTKLVAAATKWEVDPHAMSKAETGAVGRALGMAGILVIPGSGVATAEDMLELSEAPAGAVAEPELPAPTAVALEDLSDEQLRERAAALVDELGGLDPKRHTEFQEWARGRKLTLAEAQGAPLRGAVKKLEKTIAEARDAG